MTNQKNTEAIRLDFWLGPLPEGDGPAVDVGGELFEDPDPQGNYEPEEPIALPRVLPLGLAETPVGISLQRKERYPQPSDAKFENQNPDSEQSKDWLMHYMLHNIGNM